MPPKNLGMSLKLDVGGILDNNASGKSPRRSPISGISMSKFGGRGGGSVLPSPSGGDFTRDARKMWEKPTGRDAQKMFDDLARIDDKAPQDSGLKFDVVIKQDDDEEVFETEILEVNGKAYEEGAVEKLTLKNEKLLNADKDFMATQDTNEVSTDAAMNFFMELEQNEEVGESWKNFTKIEPASFEETVDNLTRFRKSETPSERMQRLQREMSALETELQELEKEEWPTQLTSDPLSSKEQLTAINDMRDYIQTVVGSAHFQSLEEKQPIDFNAIISNGHNAAETNLQSALSTHISTKISNFENDISSNVSVSQNQLELVVNAHAEQLAMAPDSLKRESTLKFQQLCEKTDKFEENLGNWNPSNKFISLFQILDQLWEQVDEISSAQRQEGGERSGSDMQSISKRAKELYEELQRLNRKFSEMPEIDYDKNKVDFVHMFTERALEGSDHVQFITDRLKVLEHIHESSPNVDNQIIKLVQESKGKVPKTLQNESNQIKEVKQLMVSQLKELQTLMQPLQTN